MHTPTPGPGPPGRPRRWPRSVRAGLALLVTLVVTWGACFAIRFLQFVREAPADAFSQELVARMLVLHMEWHGGAWPRGWEDLEEAYEASAQLPAGGEHHQDLLRRVVIDFSADPGELLKAPLPGAEPPFRVISLRSGKSHHWEGSEPNRLVWDYLQERAQRPPGHNSPRPPYPAERAARQALLSVGGTWELDDGGRVRRVSLGSPVDHPRFRDEHLALLQPLAEIRELDMGYSDITDAGLAHVRHLARLRTIYLYGTRVTDAGLAHLVGMADLEALVLASPNFTDGALEHIVKHRRLRLLNLNGARVTDAGLARLHGLKGLRDLQVGDTRVTADGVRDLKRSLPGCQIYWTGRGHD